LRADTITRPLYNSSLKVFHATVSYKKNPDVPLAENIYETFDILFL